MTSSQNSGATFLDVGMDYDTELKALLDKLEESEEFHISKFVSTVVNFTTHQDGSQTSFPERVRFDLDSLRNLTSKDKSVSFDEVSQAVARNSGRAMTTREALHVRALCNKLHNNVHVILFMEPVKDLIENALILSMFDTDSAKSLNTEAVGELSEFEPDTIWIYALKD